LYGLLVMPTAFFLGLPYGTTYRIRSSCHACITARCWFGYRCDTLPFGLVTRLLRIWTFCYCGFYTCGTYAYLRLPCTVDVVPFTPRYSHNVPVTALVLVPSPLITLPRWRRSFLFRRNIATVPSLPRSARSPCTDQVTCWFGCLDY
jgi:hypothetical protein